MRFTKNLDVNVDLDENDILEAFDNISLWKKSKWISTNYSPSDLFNSDQLLCEFSEEELRDELLRRKPLGKELL